MYSSRFFVSSFLVANTLLMIAVGCSDSDPRIAPGDRLQKESGDVTRVVEPYPTTPIAYDASLKGETSIADLIALIKTDNKGWYGVSKEDKTRFTSDKCAIYNNKFEELNALPAVIKGVVTFHPRMFKKLSYCGFDTRNYGSFWIQDSTGGIFVARESRVADFDVGDVIEIQVRGVMNNWKVPTVTTFDSIKIVERNNLYAKVPNRSIYAKEIAIKDAPSYFGTVVTVTGEIVSEPTNYNFNSACIVPIGADKTPCQGSCLSDKTCRTNDKMYLAIDREIGQRKPLPLDVGQQLKVTGPVAIGFTGNEISVAEIGQLSNQQ